MKKIIAVVFPNGNAYEGSACCIIYEDSSTEITIADTFYQRTSERGLSREEIKKIAHISFRR
jgi:hypothetical protein